MKNQLDELQNEYTTLNKLHGYLNEERCNLLKECSQIHKNYENLKASKHNLWVDCEGLKKSLKFSNDKLKQYEAFQKQPQDVVTLHREIEFLRETLSKFVGITEKLNKMLRYPKCLIVKFGNGYKGKNYAHEEETIVCYFYGKVGHMTSKCRHLPKTWSTNTFRTNKKGPNKIWVLEEKIIHVVDMFNHNKDTPIMVLWLWLFTSHDRRKVYAPMPHSHAW